MLRYFISLVFLPCFIMAGATYKVPSMPEMDGDYIIMNYKEYNDQKFLADMKAMRMETTREGLKISGFYILGSEDFIAGYNTSTGTISVPAATKVLGENIGFEQYLYLWDDDKEEVVNSDINFLLMENGSWEVASSIVLLSGVDGGELSPYYFSNGTVITKANAETSNVSYVGWGNEQEKFEEERPSLIEISNNRITVTNLLQKDQFGYGCRIEGTFTSDGKALFSPAVIGQSNDGTYKVLAGCEYDENQNKPTDVTFAGDRSEGVVSGHIDLNTGTLEIGPMAIWTGSEKNGYVTINSNRSYFEFIKSVKVTFTLPPSSSIEKIEDSHNSKEIIKVEYYNLMGQAINEPASGSFVIQRIHYKNHFPESKKIYIR